MMGCGMYVVGKCELKSPHRITSRQTFENRPQFSLHCMVSHSFRRTDMESANGVFSCPPCRLTIVVFSLLPRTSPCDLCPDILVIERSSVCGSEELEQADGGGLTCKDSHAWTTSLHRSSRLRFRQECLLAELAVMFIPYPF